MLPVIHPVIIARHGRMISALALRLSLD